MARRKEKVTKPYVLTRETYYDSERPHLSASRIIDYLGSPRYYKAKHIDKALKPFKLTPDMKLGKMVDAYLTEPEEFKKYTVKSPMKSEYDCSESMMEEAIARAEEIKRQPYWHQFMAEYQVIFEDEYEGVKLCGMADRVDLVKDANGDKHVLITDVKSTNPRAMSSPRNWYWNAKDRMYDVQFAMYRWFASRKYGVPPENVHVYHACVTSEDGWAQTMLFSFPAGDLDLADPRWQDAVVKIRDGHFPETMFHRFADAILCTLA